MNDLTFEDVESVGESMLLETDGNRDKDELACERGEEGTSLCPETGWN